MLTSRRKTLLFSGAGAVTTDIAQVFHFAGNDEFIAAGAALTALTAADDYMLETYIWTPLTPSNGGLFGNFNGTDGLFSQITSGNVVFQWRGGTTRRHAMNVTPTHGQYNHFIVYIPGGTDDAADWDIYVNKVLTTQSITDNDDRINESSLVVDLGDQGNGSHSECRIAYLRYMKGSFTIDQDFVDGRDPLFLPAVDDVSGLTGTNLYIAANDAIWDGDSVTGSDRLDTGTFDSTNMLESELESFNPNP